ncbi:MAG: hypothetical protein CMB98_01590, partial [Flavobacteriaceae bacterium]|nr:hypothetical protein [Flavobacteriaceae bacterium]
IAFKKRNVRLTNYNQSYLQRGKLSNIYFLSSSSSYIFNKDSKKKDTWFGENILIINYDG